MAGDGMRRRERRSRTKSSGELGLSLYKLPVNRWLHLSVDPKLSLGLGVQGMMGMVENSRELKSLFQGFWKDHHYGALVNPKL
jgi:hypothetical protein